jgi:hypothetical protein
MTISLGVTVIAGRGDDEHVLFLGGLNGMFQQIFRFPRICQLTAADVDNVGAMLDGSRNGLRQ